MITAIATCPDESQEIQMVDFSCMIQLLQCVVAVAIVFVYLILTIRTTPNAAFISVSCVVLLITCAHTACMKQKADTIMQRYGV